MRNLILGFVFLTGAAFGQSYEAFTVFDAKGKQVKVSKMMKDAAAHQFVFFGEFHDNPISHWLQYELTKSLYAAHAKNLVIGFEMFERDQQRVLDAYLAGQLTDKQFKDSCRLWPNYKTDYKPIVDFARDSSLRCIADNVPRPYANLLFKKGRSALDTLSATEKSWLAPLDFVIDTTLSQYAALLEMGAHMGGSGLMQAQAFKDATMAHFILKDKKPGDVVLHLNGAYHSDFYQGIMWYIKQQVPEATMLSVSTVSQTDISKLEKEHLGRADYIICVNANMTSTH